MTTRPASRACAARSGATAGIVAEPVSRLLFGDVYASAVNVVYLLLAGNLWFALSSSGTAVLNMVKQTRLTFLLTAASTVLLVGLGLWLIPRFGAVGAGVATCAALGVHALATMGFARRHLSGGVVPQAGRSIALAAMIPLAIGVIVLPNGLQHAGEFVLAALAYLVAYVGLLFALRVFTADDLTMLQGLIRVPSRAQP
jgi:O-antigen/teichoic acid export membrane protein